MAIVLMEGFDHRDNSGARHTISGMTEWVTGRFGRGYAARSRNSWPLQLPNYEGDVLILSTALAAIGNTHVSYYSINGNRQLAIVFSASDGYIRLYRDGTLFYTSPISFTFNTWSRIEIRTRIDRVAGLVEIRQSGEDIFSYYGNTARDNLSTSELRAVRMVFQEGFHDDIVIMDESGTEFNTWIGDVEIATQVPNANGSASQMVGSDGNSVDNYMLVDELPVSTSDFVRTNVSGNRDLYGFTDTVVRNGQVLAVQISAHVTKESAGETKLKIVERLANGSERVSEPITVNNSHWIFSRSTKDPEDSAWTIPTLDSSEFGLELL